MTITLQENQTDLDALALQALGPQYPELTEKELNHLCKEATTAVAGRKKRDDYFQGEVHLASMGVNVPPELDILKTVFNYPMIAVNSIEERQDVEGFRLAGDAEASEMMWEIWQRNDLDEQSSMAHQEALVQKRAYLIIGQDDDGLAAITVHTAEGMHVEFDRVTRRVTKAFHVWASGDGAKHEDVSATLYTAAYNQDYYRRDGIWTVGEIRVHNIGYVPVVPMVNRARIGDFRGRSEMDAVVKWTDAAARLLTNLQVAAEFLAMPQRMLFGVEKGEVTMDGALSKLQAYATNLLGFSDKDAKAVQFAGADLRNFNETLTTLNRAVCAHTGLPLSYLGISAANPSSADAIVNEEARLIKKVERKNKLFGAAWELAMRIALIIEGKNTKATRVETIWRDPATPTMASKVDAVIKLRTPNVNGDPVISDEKAREMIGMSAEENRLEGQRLAKAKLDPLIDAYGLQRKAAPVGS
ncbi:MAG TPA: phage portal protein [Arthrobacter sp.]